MVLDLDDTLYLERDYVRSGFGAVGDWAKHRLKISDFGERAYAYFEAGRRGDIFNAVLDELKYESEPDLISSMIEVYRQHSPVITLLPDSVEFLDFCRSVGSDLALITDGPLESQRNKVTALGIEPLFSVVVLTGRWPNGSKPNPRAFEFVQHEMKDVTDEFWYIADNPAKDFQAPLKLGWRTARIRRRLGLHYDVEPQTNCRPEFEFPDLYALKGALLSGSLSRRMI